MKRIIPSALVLIAIAVGAFVLVQPEVAHRPRAAEIAPPETLFFVQLPDVRRSLSRWPQTGLFHIWQEPEVQAFLDLPRRTMPLMLQAQATLARLDRVAPREGFVALTAIDGIAPRFVAGFAFSGSRRAVAELMAEPREAWRKAWPGGRSARLNFGGCEIETYAMQEQTVAECFHAGWYFVANDLDVLKGALERCDRDRGSGLASTTIFQRSTELLQTDCDALIFARTGAFYERLGLLAEAAHAPTVADSQVDGAVLAWGAKFDGAQVRDTIILTGTSNPAATILPRASRTLSSADSVLYAAMAVPEKFEVPAAFTSVLAFAAPVLAALEGDRSRRSITWGEFGAAFGPEVGVLVDWPESADAPTVLLALAVRDAEKARTFADALTDPVRGGVGWLRAEKDGVRRYEAPVATGGGAAPGIALSRRFAVLGADKTAVGEGLARMEAGVAAIDVNAAFRSVARQVAEPMTSFGFLDLRMLVERSYPMLRPFLAMSLNFSPETGRYFDAGKLPSTEAIAAHLGPSIFSQSAIDRGMRLESVGTFTFSQTLVGVLAGMWTSAAPTAAEKKENSAGFHPQSWSGSPRGPGTPTATKALPAVDRGAPANISSLPKATP